MPFDYTSDKQEGISLRYSREWEAVPPPGLPSLPPERMRLSDDEVERIAEKVVQILDRNKLMAEVKQLMKTWPAKP